VDQLLAPLQQALILPFAQVVAQDRPSEAAQQRLDYLAEQANEGLLTPDERADYDWAIDALDWLFALRLQALRTGRESNGETTRGPGTAPRSGTR
jgi:hypothetical protein